MEGARWEVCVHTLFSFKHPVVEAFFFFFHHSTTLLLSPLAPDHKSILLCVDAFGRMYSKERNEQFESMF